MQILIKSVLSVMIILGATALARRFPSLAGLIGVMPLTGALVLVWVHLENNGRQEIMEDFARGALWGILPSILFFLAALFCLKKNLPLPLVLLISFGIWTGAASLHQWFLR